MPCISLFLMRYRLQTGINKPFAVINPTESTKGLKVLFFYKTHHSVFSETWHKRYRRIRSYDILIRMHEMLMFRNKGWYPPKYLYLYQNCFPRITSEKRTMMTATSLLFVRITYMDICLCFDSSLMSLKCMKKHIFTSIVFTKDSFWWRKRQHGNTFSLV